MLTFNNKGYLVPNSPISTDIEVVKKQLVVEYFSLERTRLFEEYTRYIQDLKSLCGDVELLQWINGSFATKRKPSPNDLDLVVFIDNKILQQIGADIKEFVYPQSKINYFGIDAYVVRRYPIKDGKHKLFKFDQAYWFNQFSTTRRNRKGIKEDKGFLEVCF
jgi:hypothetical protein